MGGGYGDGTYGGGWYGDGGGTGVGSREEQRRPRLTLKAATDAAKAKSKAATDAKVARG